MRPLRAAARAAGLRRDHLRAARVLAQRRTGAAWGRRQTAASGRVLCYHAVGTPAWGCNDVSPARFRRQLELALRSGYRFVPAATLAAGSGGPRDLALTFDDGLRSVAEQAAPVLARLGIPWTVFVVTDWAAGRGHGFGDLFLDWEGLRRLVAAGAAVGSHSVSHPDFGGLPEDRALHELAASRREIEARTGAAADAFAVPGGGARGWSPRLTELAGHAGYRVVYASPGQAGTVPRTGITRFDDDPAFLAALEGAFDR